MSAPRAVDLPKRTVAYNGPITTAARWDSFSPREDDIFISTPDKCGTTWTQAICAMLIFGKPDIDVQPAMISPWLDAEMIPLDAMNAMLEAQTHRRFIKTHTPLDGIPFYPRCTYLAVYRDPRDVHLSMRNHVFNMKNDIFDDKMPDDIGEGFRMWMQEPHVEGARETFNLESIVHHYKTFKAYSHLPNIHLFHYGDMKRDLRAQMAWMAGALRIDVPDPLLDQLVEAAGFANMKKNASQFAPGAGMDIWKDEGKFFNKGATSQWRDVLSEEDLATYDKRIRELLSEDDVAWLENGSGG